MTNNAVNWYMSEFPEALYPCSEEHSIYKLRVITGKTVMSHKNIVICGIARDVEKFLLPTIARIQRLGEMFNDYRVIIFENDSEDYTLDVLESWAKANQKVYVIHENLGHEKNFSEVDYERTERMAICRNKYLEAIRSGGAFIPRNLDYIIVVDMDIEGGWSYHGIANTFGTLSWDACGSNGLIYEEDEDGNTRRLYYDAWAYRRLGHRDMHDFGEANVLLYHRGQELIKVYSCFGGLMIYRSDLLLNNDVWYEGHDCDHPTLNLQLVNLGYKIYMNPSQIVLHSPTEYCL